MAKRKTKKLNLPVILITVGILFSSLSLLHNFLKQRSQNLGAQLVAEYQSDVSTTSPLPIAIKIPWFVDVTVTGSLYQDGRWNVSDTQATYLLNSARPGESGNQIIYGHNTRSILGNIRALKGGEIITLTLSDNTTLTYKVTKAIEVSPKEISYLQPTDQSVLTLFTCSGPLDSRRFVVRAVPVLE